MLYPWIILAVLIIVLFFMPKRLTLKENILVFASIGYIAWNSHMIIGVMLDLLDFGRSKEVEFIDWLFVTLSPPLIAVLYLNFKKTDRYLLYAIGWTILSFFFEWSLVLSGYMKNVGWKTWYAIPVYLAIYLFLPWFLNTVIRGSNVGNQRKGFSLHFDAMKKIRFRKSKVTNE